MKQLIDLNGKWELYIAPHNQVKDLVEWDFMNPDCLCKDTEKNVDFIKIDAEVPGNFELDLERAGLLPDLFLGTNTLLCQQYENRHLWYVKEFTLDKLPEGDAFSHLPACFYSQDGHNRRKSNHTPCDEQFLCLVPKLALQDAYLASTRFDKIHQKLQRRRVLRSFE